MITPAFAQTTSPIAGGAIDFLIPMIPVFAIFYFLVIRPQQKRMKEHQALIDAVKRGDTVVTTGGIIGKVIRVGPEGELRVEIANNVQIQIVKSAISEVRSKGEPVRRGGGEERPTAGKRRQTGQGRRRKPAAGARKTGRRRKREATGRLITYSRRAAGLARIKGTELHVRFFVALLALGRIGDAFPFDRVHRIRAAERDPGFDL